MRLQVHAANRTTAYVFNLAVGSLRPVGAVRETLGKVGKIDTLAEPQKLEGC